MQVEATGLYRVKALAEALDISPATIYRAVESGALRAVRVGRAGSTRRAIRIKGEAFLEYLAACETTAVTTAQPEPAAQAGGIR
jgi:excisionase family DNA binding protein